MLFKYNSYRHYILVQMFAAVGKQSNKYSNSVARDLFVYASRGKQTENVNTRLCKEHM